MQTTRVIQRSFHLFIVVGGLLLSLRGAAQVPQLISYQGRVLMNGTNFTGNGQFKFALVNNGATVTFWSNDGSSSGGSQPTAAVSLPVANGLITTLLGDTGIANMTALPTSVFSNADVRLRIWFDGGAGFEQLSPDQRVVSVGYAMMSATVPDAAITAAKLAAGVLHPTNFPPNSVTSNQLADSISLGAAGTVGRLDVYRTGAGTPAVTLDGALSAITTYGVDGLEQIRLHGTSWGEVLLHNSLANNAVAVNLTAQGSTGGRLSLNNTNGSSRAILEGENVGGLLTLYQADGGVGAILYGNEGSGSGALSLRNTNGSPRLRAYGGPASGSLEMYDADGTQTFVADASGGTLTLRQPDNTTGLSLAADNGSGGGGLSIYRDNGTFAGQLTVGSTTTRDGFLGLTRSNSTSFGVIVRGSGGANGGQVSLYEGDGTETVTATSGGGGNVVLRQADGSVGLGVSANNGTGGGGLSIYRDNGTFAGQLTVGGAATPDGFLGLTRANSTSFGLVARGSANGGGFIQLYDSAGVATITIDSDQGNEGRITTEVLTITGGADLSEQFDINAGKDQLQPGMLVSIDAKNAGELVLSASAYDRKVAGVISGAGGVKPGMMMGQVGTKADGKHPVALTGRVYCWVDADASGAIEPGDLLTTSATAGHAMKVNDTLRASGAIVGKAMTALNKGKGLVLVLVSLQ